MARLEKAGGEVDERSLLASLCGMKVIGRSPGDARVVTSLAMPGGLAKACNGVVVAVAAVEYGDTNLVPKMCLDKYAPC